MEERGPKCMLYIPPSPPTTYCFRKNTDFIQLFSGLLFIPFHYPKYPLARSLLSQSVDSSEVGRIFSSLSFISCFIHFISHPLYAIIYDSSIESYPGAFILFTGLIIYVAMFIMILIKFLLKRYISIK